MLTLLAIFILIVLPLMLLGIMIKILGFKELFICLGLTALLIGGTFAWVMALIKVTKIYGG